MRHSVQQIEIRKAELDDAEAIVQLVNRSYRPAPGTGGWTHESALVAGERLNANMVNAVLQNAVVLLGVNESEIVACVQIELHGRAAHIGMLAVDPALQAAGVGKRLLKRAEAFATETLNAEEAILIVIAARTELIDFYLRRGYRQTGERLPYPVEAGVGVPTEQAMAMVILKKSLTNERTRHA